MDTVRLGPLNEITQPLRRAHVPMLEVTIKSEQITDQRCGERIESEHDDGDENVERHLDQHFERVKQDRARDVDAVRAVMHLMQHTPEEVDAMRRAVIRVGDSFEQHKSDDRAADNAEPRAVEPTMRVEPVRRNQQRRHGRNRADQHEKSDPDPLPTFAGRELPRGPELLGDQEDEIRDGGEQSDDVDGVHVESPFQAGEALIESLRAV